MYFITYKFPLSYIDDGMVKVLLEEDAIAEDITNAEELKKVIDSSDDGIANLDEESSHGRIDKLHDYLVSNKIPFDLYCSDGDGYPPEMTYFRPELKGCKTFQTDYDGNEVLTVYTLKRLLDKSTDLKKDVKMWLENNSPVYYKPLGHYVDNHNPIKLILDRLDNGELTEKEAFELIKKERKKEKEGQDETQFSNSCG